MTATACSVSLAFGGARPEALLGPLALAVWTTVFGLAYSIWLSAQFGIKLPAWVDVCEKNIEAWSANEITINWNAPFAWVTAFLDEKGPRAAYKAK